MTLPVAQLVNRQSLCKKVITTNPIKLVVMSQYRVRRTKELFSNPEEKQLRAGHKPEREIRPKTWALIDVQSVEERHSFFCRMESDGKQAAISTIRISELVI